MTTKREVFEVGDLMVMNEKPNEKGRISTEIFEGITNKARAGDIAAVNWLVDHGFMSVNRLGADGAWA